MKEYRSRSGGRFIFNEDIHNLQELALSSVEMFKDSGENFVISGCAISITQRMSNGLYYFDISVSSGYAFINNRIRKIAAFTKTVNSFQTIGIYETLSDGPDIMYANGSIEPEYNNYAGVVKIDDPNNGNTANILATSNNGAINSYVFPNLRTAYLRHYCLVNNGTMHHYNDAPTFERGCSVRYQIDMIGNNDAVIPIIAQNTAVLPDFYCAIVSSGEQASGISIGGKNILASDSALLINSLVVKNLYATNLVEAAHLNYPNHPNGQDPVLVEDIVNFFDRYVNRRTVKITGPTVPGEGASCIEIYANDASEQYIQITGNIEYEDDNAVEIYDSVTIRPHQITVFDSTDPDNQTKLESDSIYSKNIYATYLYDRTIGAQSRILVSDLTGFFINLKNNKTIEIIGPDNEYNHHGHITIFGNEVQGQCQYIEITNSADDDGDFDSIKIEAHKLTVHNGDQDPVILTAEGLFGDIHSESIYDRETGDNILVADIINFFQNQSDGNSSEPITVSELNAIFNMERSELAQYVGRGFVNRMLTTTVQNTAVQVGYVSLFSCDMRHQITVEVTSNYVLCDDDVIGQNGHQDGHLFTYVRHYGFRDSPNNGLVNGEWTDWQEKCPQTILDQFDEGYTGSFTVDGKTLTFTGGLLTDVQ